MNKEETQKTKFKSSKHKKPAILVIVGFCLIGTFFLIKNSFSYLGYIGSNEVSTTKGLVAHYTMDENDYNSSTNRLSDKSSNENHGTNSGAIFTEDRFGKEGGAMSFDGSGTIDGLVYGNNIELPEEITDTRNCLNGCTYSIWINVDEDAVDRMSLFRGHSTIRHIEILTSTKKFRTEAALQNGYSFGTSNFPDDVRGVWSHFVIVFAENEPNRPVYWYQNGQLFHEGTMTNGTYPDTEYFSFGSIGRSTGTVNYQYAKSFDGKIDDVRIYNRALSQEEIQSLYDSYEPKTVASSLQKGLVLDMPLKLKYTKDETSGSEIMTDRTPYSNDGQNYGATITSDGASFDGVNDYVNCGNSDLLMPSSITVSGWVKLSDSSSWMMVNKQTGGYPGSYYIHGNSPSAIWSIFGPSSSRYNVSLGTLNIGDWYHLVGTYDFDTKVMKGYKNGSLIGTTNNAELGYNSADLLIGRYTSGYYTNGDISNIKIYNRALSDEEVKMLYDRGRSDAGIIFQNE